MVKTDISGVLTNIRKKISAKVMPFCILFKSFRFFYNTIEYALDIYLVVFSFYHGNIWAILYLYVVGEVWQSERNMHPGCTSEMQ